MAFASYKSAPITEAVIALNYASDLADSDAKKAAANLRADYPNEQPIESFDLDLNVKAVARGPSQSSEANANVDVKAKRKMSYRLASNDQSEVCLILPNMLIVSQLAPYPGWEAFFARFKRTIGRFSAAAEYRKRTRVGVRFINRLDLPILGVPVEYENFFRVHIAAPASFGPNIGYTATVRFLVPEVKGTLTISTASAQSPVPNHVGFMLDIDVGIEQEVPQRDDELERLLESVRVVKNRVFEECISQAARKKFAL